MKTEIQKFFKYFKGLTLILAQTVLPILVNESKQGCILLKKGEGEKVTRVAKKVNARVEEAKKIRLGLQTALTEISKNGTKKAFPQLIWFVFL